LEVGACFASAGGLSGLGGVLFLLLNQGQPLHGHFPGTHGTFGRPRTPAEANRKQAKPEE